MTLSVVALTTCHANDPLLLVHHCTTLPQHTILYHTVPHCTTIFHNPHCTTLYHNEPHCTNLYHTVPQFATLPQCATLCHLVPRSTTVYQTVVCTISDSIAVVRYLVLTVSHVLCTWYHVINNKKKHGSL